MQKFSLVFVALALASAVLAAEVQFGTTKSCDAGSFSEDYQNVACNSCVDPPGGECCGLLSHLLIPMLPGFADWQAILFSGLDSAQRWTGHNEVCRLITVDHNARSLREF